MRLVGEDVSKILDMIAAQMKVIEVARLKKSCRCCEKMVQVPAPSRPIPGSMAGAGLLAYILVSKFDDHLPLYRLNEILARMGADIPDSTLVFAGRTEATGRGVQFAIQSYLRDPRTRGFNGKRDLKGAAIIVQGSGNVGYHAAKFLAKEDDARVMIVAERDGYVTNADGVVIEALKQHQIKTGSILGFEGATSFPGDMTGIEQPCDVLIPAAMENAIHAGNAGSIKANLIVEAANGPVTFEADKALRTRGITILPDLYVNAGGVVVSYFEWVKNLTHIPFGLMERRRRERRNQMIAAALERMTGKEFPADIRDEFLEGAAEIDLVRSGLEDVMRSTWARIADLIEQQPKLGDYRTAAYVAVKPWADHGSRVSTTVVNGLVFCSGRAWPEPDGFVARETRRE